MRNQESRWFQLHGFWRHPHALGKRFRRYDERLENEEDGSEDADCDIRIHRKHAADDSCARLEQSRGKHQRAEDKDNCGKEAGKAKQFRRGIEQLDTEGVVQVLSSDLRGDQAPVLAAVGPLQFDVVLHRLEHEFGARAELDHLDYSMARRTDLDGARTLAGQRAVEVLARRHDGTLLALFSDKWRLAQVQREHPDILLEPLIAG